MIEIIKPEVEVLDLEKLKEDKFGIIASPASRVPEYVGRVCYNSYDNMTEESYKQFNKKAANDSHRSIFEFNNIRISISINSNYSLVNLRSSIRENLFLKYNIISNEEFKGDVCYLVNIYGSCRSYIELLEKVVGGTAHSNFNLWLYVIIFEVMEKIVPSIFSNWSTIKEITKFYSSIKEMTPIPPYSYNDITTNINIKGDKFKKMLVKVVSDKGVHNELVRHRPMSFMAESQRYVRYGNGDNKKNPLRICVSTKDLEDSVYGIPVIESAKQSLNTYIELLDKGYPAQKARAVLPVGTAMTYFMYADLEEWRHVFSLRTSKFALPMAQEIVKEIRDQMVNKQLI